MVVSVAGNVDHAQLLTVLEREGWFEGAAPEPPRRPVAATAAIRAGVASPRMITSKAIAVSSVESDSPDASLRIAPPRTSVGTYRHQQSFGESGVDRHQ